jgi:hypothetical protein
MFNDKMRRMWLCFCTVGLLLSCSDDPDTGANGLTESVTKTISALTGGTILSPTGVQLTIPAGALTEDVEITIGKGDQSLPDGMDAYGAVYTFLPEGLTFNTDGEGQELRATVWLPYEPPTGGGAADVCWSTPGDPSTFNPIIGLMFTPRVEAQANNGSPPEGGSQQGVDISHFSRGFVGTNNQAYERCKVLEPGSCSDDTKCIVETAGNSYCVPYEASGYVGDPCTDSSQCDRDLYCAAGPAGGEKRCHALCDPTLEADCGEGEDCRRLQVREYNGEESIETEFGVCTTTLDDGA